MKHVRVRPLLLALLVCAVTAAASAFIPLGDGILAPVLLRGLLVAVGVMIALLIYQWDSKRSR